MPRGNKLVPRTAPTPLVSAAFAAFVLLCFVTLLSVFLCLFGVFGAKTAFFEEIAAVSPRWCGALWFDMFLMPLITMFGSPQKHFWLFLVPKLHQTAFFWANCSCLTKMMWGLVIWVLSDDKWTSWSLEPLFYYRHMTTGLNDLLSYFSTPGKLTPGLHNLLSPGQMTIGLDDLLSYLSNWSKWQRDLLVSWAIEQMTLGPNDLLSYFSIEANDNWISCFLELLLYFRQVRTGLHDLLSSWQMTTGLDDLLSYFSNWSHGNGTYWSLYFFYLKQMTAGLTDLLSYFSTSGKWQLDLMISELQANDNWT